MSTSVSLIPVVRYIGNPVEKGGPHGYFGGSVINTMTAGGTGAVNVLFPIKMAQGLLVVFRHIVAWNDDTTSRVMEMQLRNSYWNQLVSLVPTLSLPSVVGVQNSVAKFLEPGNPLIWQPESSLDESEMFSILQASVDTVKNGVFVQGEIWQESRLRQDHHGPLLRW